MTTAPILFSGKTFTRHFSHGDDLETWLDFQERFAGPAAPAAPREPPPDLTARRSTATAASRCWRARCSSR